MGGQPELLFGVEFDLRLHVDRKVSSDNMVIYRPIRFNEPYRKPSITGVTENSNVFLKFNLAAGVCSVAPQKCLTLFN
jgi:hypothetical protein